MANNEFGDFQTPLNLAEQCLELLHLPRDARILEPTCGKGSFLCAAATIAPESRRVGIEVNPDYVKEASSWAKVFTANVFEENLADFANRSPGTALFVIGNPPWVTAAELKRLGSNNLPPKENFKNVKGLEALLGASNFDVSEFIILKILRELCPEPFTLGMLCKTQVVRNVVEYAAKFALPLARSRIYRIDAMRWFGANVDACWFTAEIDSQLKPDYTVDIFENVINPTPQPTSRFGIVDSRLVSDVDKYREVSQADGQCPYEWRSGLKHDAASVFELLATPQPTTKTGKTLHLEPQYVYPFLKSTDIFRGRHHELSKWVIVPQMEFGADTLNLRITAPNLWHYLESNAAILDRRKSSIYRNRPRFSVFGHGDYTFAPYKVAVSGLHKEPVFRLVTPINGKPVVLDDTCYLLPFTDPTEAVLVTVLLSSPECRALIDSLVFWDAKRPLTKRLLSRLNLNRLPVDRETICAQAQAAAATMGIPFDTVRAQALIGNLGVKQPATLF